jgi:hypothetical protein
MLWLGPKFDRFFFPVRDAYAVKQEKKYAGMSIVEIDDIKHAETRNRLKFAAVWLGGTTALMVALPHAPVALMAIGWFAACWVGRKVLGGGKPRRGERSIPSPSPSPLRGEGSADQVANHGCYRWMQY